MTSLWADGDYIELTMDDGIRFDVLLTDVTATTITYAETTTEDAAVGARLVKKLAPTLNGVFYGTAAVDTLTWGLRRLPVGRSVELVYASPLAGSDSARGHTGGLGDWCNGILQRHRRDGDLI